jgi:crotonobetainyl-CoA:carnitine CoA-transferase CaiB-like acyl-CoA transferase
VDGGAESLLEGLRVLDLADESGFLCGRILADLGADVVKVEPPGGDRGRRVPPFADDRPELERSLSWLAGNVNKRGITCDLGCESGRALFRCLAERADVVVETFPVGYLDGLGLGYAALAEANRGLILTSITPYGGIGPRADWPGSDLEINAASGTLWLAGDPDKPPVRTSLPTSPGWSGLGAAMGTLTALLARDATGLGQHVDVSAQASLLAAIAHAPIFWDIARENPGRSGPYISGRSVSGAAFRNIWPCRDGYVAFALYGGPVGRQTGKTLVAWMEERGGAPESIRKFDWDSFDVATASRETVAELEAAIGPFLLGLTRREFFKGVVERNMLGYPAATVEDIWRDEQLAARGFWQQVEVPWGRAGETLPFPGSFALFDGERPAIRRPAPRLGEHNAEIYGGELGLTAEDLAALRGAGVI